MILPMYASTGAQGECVRPQLSATDPLVRDAHGLPLSHASAHVSFQVLKGSTYVRPQLSATGPLAIRAGRHPLLDSLPGITYQPNDCYISPQAPLHIIGGPNMSGKSTYLKQVCQEGSSPLSFLA
jgi:dsDNA-specific endonuclease/ATPase MutS2